MSLDISLVYPETCPHCRCEITLGATALFESNFTHNVIPMWKKAGVYEALYLSQGKLARQYIEALRLGVADMESKFSEYEKLDAPNGWGLAKQALPWLESVLQAFQRYPDLMIHVSK